MFVAVVGLVRGHDLVGLSGEHGEVLVGFPLPFLKVCSDDDALVGVVSLDGLGGASAEMAEGARAPELSGSSFPELILQRQMAWDFLNKALKVEHGSGAGWLSNALTENV